jgi:signal transduction histidine kinase
MKLARFIQQNSSAIITEWEDFARKLIPAATDMTPLALRNHIKDILAFIIDDMEQPQSNEEQIEKSHGEGKQNEERKPSAAETHAALRLAGGFDLDQMVSEYRALRASIIKLWLVSTMDVNPEALQDMVRFNEAVDQASTESISHYAKKLAASKDLFLGILTHDIRNPLGAMMGAAELIPMIAPLTDKQKALNSQIQDSGGRIKEIVSHLLDITKARFGAGLPVIKSPMDMGFVARQLVDEMRAQHPQRKFNLEVTGDTEGEWDKARIGQVFSNLIGNAVQYGFKSSPIDIVLKGATDEVTLSVHNDGIPIPPAEVVRIFDSLTRVTGEDVDTEEGAHTNLGLGLFITREIVVAHGGKIAVESNEKKGTAFTVSFPREKNCV